MLQPDNPSISTHEDTNSLYNPTPAAVEARRSANLPKMHVKSQSDLRNLTSGTHNDAKHRLNSYYFAVRPPVSQVTQDRVSV